MAQSRLMIPARILGTGTALLGRPVPTREVSERAYPEREPGWLESRTGIAQRYWVEPGTTRAQMGTLALRQALEAAQLPAAGLERIIFVDSAGGDFKLPATANAIAAALELEASCDCFDLNNTCTGFLTAMDLATRCVATGSGPVAVVTAELWSQHIGPSEPRTYAVFGDAAAAVIFGPARGDEGVLASHLRNDGLVGGSVVLDHGGFTGTRELVRFRVDNKQIGKEATEAVLTSARRVLSAAGVGVDELAWFLPHQPNGRMLETMRAGLGIAPERTVPIVREVGSVSTASIPLSLDRLLRRGQAAPGELILFAAVGSGLSYGAMLYRVGA